MELMVTSAWLRRKVSFLSMLLCSHNSRGMMACYLPLSVSSRVEIRIQNKLVFIIASEIITVKGGS